MKKIKRLLAAGMAALLTLNTVTTIHPPLQLHATERAEDFTVVNGTLTKYNGPGGNVVLPSTVTTIGNQAFTDCTGIQSITVPKSVVTIADNAFMGCDASEITLPDTVVKLGIGVFHNCKQLQKVSLPEGLKSIPIGSFLNCTSLSSVLLPSSVKTIEEQAFSGCVSLGEEIAFPNGLESIKSSAFNNCNNLYIIKVPDSITTIAENAFQGCNGTFICNAGSYGESFAKQNEKAILYNNITVTLVLEDDIEINKIQPYSNYAPDPAIAKKEGYTLLGWSENPNDTTLYKNNFNLVKDTKLYPIYTKNKYTYELNLDGGTLNNGTAGDTATSGSIEYKETLELPTPEKPGYAFKGWSLCNDYTGDEVIGKDIFMDNYIVTKNTKLNALYEKIALKLNLNLNEGILKDPVKTSTLYLGDIFTIGTPERPGYLFESWSVAGAAIIQEGDYTIFKIIDTPEDRKINVTANFSTPTPEPTIIPSPSPTITPTTLAPTTKPTTQPTMTPTNLPSSAPTTTPTEVPSFVPTTKPTTVPTEKPFTPTTKPTTAPTEAPSFIPTTKPTTIPTEKPSFTPTTKPTTQPTRTPSLNPTKKTTFTLSKTRLQLKTGSKYNLKVSSNGKVSFRSSNKKIATVTSTGKITAKKAGNVNIIVSLNGVNKICKVIIKTPAPKKIKLQHTKKNLKRGNTFRIKYTLIGGTATVNFKSSNKKVATVTSRGLIRAKKKGQTTITVRTSNNKKAFIKIIVK